MGSSPPRMRSVSATVSSRTRLSSARGLGPRSANSAFGRASWPVPPTTRPTKCRFEPHSAAPGSRSRCRPRAARHRDLGVVESDQSEAHHLAREAPSRAAAGASSITAAPRAIRPVRLASTHSSPPIAYCLISVSYLRKSAMLAGGTSKVGAVWTLGTGETLAASRPRSSCRPVGSGSGTLASLCSHVGQRLRSGQSGPRPARPGRGSRR